MLGWESMAARGAAAGIGFAAYGSMSRWPEKLSLDEGWDRVVPLLRGAATRDDVVAEAHDFKPDSLCYVTRWLASAPVASLMRSRHSVVASAPRRRSNSSQDR